MRKTLIICIAFMTATFAVAQEVEKGDKKSNAMLEVLTAKTEAYKTIRVEFTYKMENTEAGIDESTRGVLLVMGNKYRLDISGQEVFCDGETLWTYIVDAEGLACATTQRSQIGYHTMLPQAGVSVLRV